MIKTYKFFMKEIQNTDDPYYPDEKILEKEIVINVKEIISFAVGTASDLNQKCIQKYESEPYKVKYRSFWFWFIPVFWLVPRTTWKSKCVQDAIYEPTLWSCTFIFSGGSELKAYFDKKEIIKIQKDMKL